MKKLLIFSLLLCMLSGCTFNSGKAILNPVETSYKNDVATVKSALDFLSIHDEDSWNAKKEDLQLVFNCQKINSILDAETYMGITTAGSLSYTIKDIRGEFTQSDTGTRDFLVALDIVDLQRRTINLVYLIRVKDSKVIEFERVF